MSDKILKNKESQAVITHLSFLQQIITRMANNSTNCKVLVAMIITVIVTLLLGFNVYQSYWWVNMFVILYGLLTDSYYLAYERIFRKSYNTFIYKINNNELVIKDIYVIKSRNSEYEGELFFYVFKAISSFSVWTYYSMLIIVIVLLKLI